MGKRRLIENYYCDVNNIADVVTKLIGSYRLLVGSAEELNRITIAKKKDVKEALDRVNDMGDIIDEYICVLDKISCTYLNYCTLKSQVLKVKIETSYILTEIDEELKFKE
ncbi:MAG: hypothetical protein ACERKV_04410 [Clostridiaceae bacterium]